jgi:hypothetical protein
MYVNIYIGFDLKIYYVAMVAFVVGWDTVLQAGSSPDEVDFFFQLT